ncbi:LlaMI family restriction endonuclease [Thiothrix subterranea]|uniref:LlaMI family restriction endonuclease n=1 Tax=Thiothrix subterranea TaxID=2735563 RepID=UPI00192C9C2F|nr:LlaMI family restriction endonuclease [Thiothrix subterranea]QQZ28874.1 LlaMI family restriction endonuclease [Thiothrix subterranea]
MANDSKRLIIELFNRNVRGKYADISNANSSHDGSEGHWLERQMDISPNSNNDADLFGYEMKKQTKSKTTFGDWSADYYLFKDDEKYPKFSRDDHFLPIFGKPNIEKNNRYSWSGEPCPKISKYNSFGQRLTVDAGSNIIAEYHYQYDQRSNKNKIVPIDMQVNNLKIAQWSKLNLKRKVENKFNQNGWFRCEKNEQGCYQSIAFGKPINFDSWIALVKSGIIFFDSGMYQGNKRHYSQWRANNNLWDSLIIDRI